jgi:16S rRNA A1518/A1519 N6-dimethyltransferase RsmA/KsgA/DIM1 with predicted DNA glycosylase/AP lyase activity
MGAYRQATRIRKIRMTRKKKTLSSHSICGTRNFTEEFLRGCFLSPRKHVREFLTFLVRVLAYRRWR